MAEKQDNTSPEEKLLKVIQEGGDQKPEAIPEEKVLKAVQQTVSDHSDAQAAPATDPTEAGRETVSAANKKPAKQALKLARTPGKSEKSDKAVDAASEKRFEVGMIGAGAQPIVVSKITARKKKDSGSTLRIVNRTLAALLVAVLCFAALEIFGTIRVGAAVDEGSVEPGAIIPAKTPQASVSVQETLTYFIGEKDPFAWSDDFAASAVATATTTAPVVPWMDYVKTNWRLMGISMGETPEGAEAIVTDTAENRMIFLQKGDSFVLQNVQVQLDSIEGDRIRLTDGKTGLDVLPTKKAEQKP